MSTRSLKIGFMPLVDAAPVIVARELGFAEEEGLDLVLQRAPSWSLLRDRLVHGESDAAQMLSPVPVAMALGLGGVPVQLDALSVLSVNGNVIGVSTAVAQRLRDAGFVPDFCDATAAGRALGALSGPLPCGRAVSVLDACRIAALLAVIFQRPDGRAGSDTHRAAAAYGRCHRRRRDRCILCRRTLGVEDCRKR